MLTDVGEGFEFGKKMLQHFQIEEGVTHLNSAGFGVVPLAVRESRIGWLDRIEGNPDLYLMDTFNEEVRRALLPLANYIGSPPSDVVFVNNITTGLSTITRNIGLGRGDKMLVFDSVYSTVRVLLDFLVEEYGVELVEFEHAVESNQSLIARFERFLVGFETKGFKLKCGVFEAISSSPGLILPYQEISRILKKHGALVIVDGAHCFGQVPLDLESTCIDFFVTNVHKWGFAYRPVALMYVRKEHQTNLNLPIISTGYAKDTFHSSFSWPGTHDFSTWLSAPEALRFRHLLGDAAIREYCHGLAWRGGHIVAKILRTQVLGEESQVGFMANVALPVKQTHGDIHQDISNSLVQHIWQTYAIRTKIFKFKQQWWTRISAQVFNDEADFQKLARCLLKAIRSKSLDAPYSTS